jgi:hypothetical protein
VPGTRTRGQPTRSTNAIQELIEAILLEPDGEQLKITLKGDLAGILSAARDSKRSPETGDLLLQMRWLRERDLNPRPWGYEGIPNHRQRQVMTTLTKEDVLRG